MNNGANTKNVPENTSRSEYLIVILKMFAQRTSLLLLLLLHRPSQGQDQNETRVDDENVTVDASFNSKAQDLLRGLIESLGACGADSDCGDRRACIEVSFTFLNSI